MICGANSADAWHQAGDTACIAPYQAVDPFVYPNDFSERTITDSTGVVTRELLVADTWHDPGGRVLRFRLDGTPIGPVPGTFNRPYGAIADADGNIIVADTFSNQIQVLFTDSRMPTRVVTSCGLDTFNGPWRVALAPGTVLTPGREQGRIFVVDANHNRIVVCGTAYNDISQSWDLITQVGSALPNPDDPSGSLGGNGPGEFAAPTAIALDQAGHLYVADPNNNRIQVFTPNATTGGYDFVAEVTNVSCQSRACWGSGTGGDYPFGVAVDANGRVLVANRFSDVISLLDTFENHFQLLNVTVGRASGGDHGEVPVPAGAPGVLQDPGNIRLDSKGRLLVADQSNHRVQRFDHPPMTLTVSSSSLPTSILPGASFPVTVDAQVAAGQVTSLMVGIVGSDASVTSISVGPYTVSSGIPLTLQITVNTSSTTTGPLRLTARGTGTYSEQLVTESSEPSDPIAVGVVGTPPVTNLVPLTLLNPDGQNGWFITRPPVVQLHADGTPTPTEIDWSIDVDQPTTEADYHVCVPQGPDCTIDVRWHEGTNFLWYRAMTQPGMLGLREAHWNKQVVLYDPSPPILTLDPPTPPANVAGWNNTSVMVGYRPTFSLAGPPSCAVGDSSCLDRNGTLTFATEGAAQTKTLQAVDVAGLKSAPVTAGPFNIDEHGPTIQSITRNAGSAPNKAGWNRMPVTVTAKATDSLSGFAAGRDTFSYTFDQEGAGPTGTGQTWTAGPNLFFDLADNPDTDSMTIGGIKIDMTPPDVSALVTPAADPTTGWHNVATGRPSVRFDASDRLSGMSGATKETTAPLADGVFQPLYSRTTFIDQAGNTARGSVNVKVDLQPPQLTSATVNPPVPDGLQGWYKTRPIVTFAATDPVPGAGIADTAVRQRSVPDGAASSVSETFFDMAGNSMTASSPALKVDSQAPLVAITPSRPPNTIDWYPDVAVTFDASDPAPASGLSGAGHQVVSVPEGLSQYASLTFSDNAGNSTSGSAGPFNVDRTDPTIVGRFVPGAGPTLTLTFTYGDALSGVASCVVNAPGDPEPSCDVPRMFTAAQAGNQITARVTDKAGRSSVVILTVSFAPPEVFNRFDLITKDVKVYALDPHTGTATGPIAPISVRSVTWGRDDVDDADDHDDDGFRGPAELRTYRIADGAGGSVTLVEKVRSAGHEVHVNMISIQYSTACNCVSQQPFLLDHATKKFEWSIDKGGELMSLEQQMNYGHGPTRVHVRAKYDGTDDKTTMTTDDPAPEKQSRIVKSGLVLLRMQTDKGAIKITD